jgi:hypothetical protein
MFYTIKNKQMNQITKQFLLISLVNLLLSYDTHCQTLSKIYDANWSISANAYNYIKKDKNILAEYALPFNQNASILFGLGVFTPGDYSHRFSLFEEDYYNYTLKNIAIKPYLGVKFWYDLPFCSAYYMLMYDYFNIPDFAYHEVSATMGYNLILFEPLFIDLGLGFGVRIFESKNIVVYDDFPFTYFFKPVVGVGFYFH